MTYATGALRSRGLADAAAGSLAAAAELVRAERMQAKARSGGPLTARAEPRDTACGRRENAPVPIGDSQRSGPTRGERYRFSSRSSRSSSRRTAASMIAFIVVSWMEAAIRSRRWSSSSKSRMWRTPMSGSLPISTW